MINRNALACLACLALLRPAVAYDVKARLDLEPLIVKHAAANNVPASLVHRVIIRESRYNPRAVGPGGAMGLMQIKHGTARALGYAGPPAGLLDANTNLAYAVRYLAGAYRVADSDQNLAVGFYARGYYYDAKRKGLRDVLARRPVVVDPPALVAAAPPSSEAASAVVPTGVTVPPAVAPRTRASSTMVPTTDESSDGSTSPRQSRRTSKRRLEAGNAVIGGQPASTEPAVSRAPSETVTVVPAPPRRRTAQRGMTTGLVPAPNPRAPSATRPDSVALEMTDAKGEPPIRRSGRPAGRTAAAGEDRSARKVSAPPGDPGRSP